MGAARRQKHHQTVLRAQARTRLQRNLARGARSDVIPPGPYCYFGCRGTPTYRPCPYWGMDAIYPAVGTCALMGVSDRTIGGVGMLFDQVKECGLRQEACADSEEDPESTPRT